MIADCKPEALARAEVPSATVRMMLGYSAGNLGKSFVWTAFESVLLYFLVSHAGMSLVHAGTLLTVLMVWDGLANLAISQHIDRTGRSDGLAALIRIGAPLCAAAFAMTFASPALGGTALAVTAVIAGRIGYTLCDVGHNTLLVRVAANERDGTTVSALRLIFTALGSGCVGIALTYVLAIDDPTAQRSAFMAFGIAGGGIYLATLLTARRATLHLRAASATPDRRNVLQPLRGLWSNRAYRQIIAVIAIQSALIPFFTRALPFLGQAALSDAAWSGGALTVITLGQSLSLPIWMLVARKSAPRPMLAIGHGGMLLSMAGLALTFGTPVAPVFLAALGASQSAMSLAAWAMLVSSVQSGRTRDGSGEALPMGLFIATMKIASGLGTTLLTTILQFAKAGGATGLGPANLILAASIGIPMIGSACILVLARRA